jgi:glycosyltransferase involved in cell wall biosynthesis
MRIAIVSTPFIAVPPKDYGGTELVVHELSEGLAARGHDVTLFATADSTCAVRLRALYAAAVWPPDPLADVNHVTWALAEAVREGFDLVHVHSAVALGASRLIPTMPFVYTLHHGRDAPFSALYEHFPDVQFVAISHDQMRREIPLPRCTVIHHGLDPARYDWTTRPGDYVCFVGRYSRVKGPHLAADAAALAGVPVHLAGRVHPPDAEFAAAELGPRLARPGVTELGPIGPAEKRALLRDARALLSPLQWHEPFGLILVEAMLSGCPPVAFARGSAPELIEHGVTGFLVESLEEMAAVIRPGGAADAFDRERCRAVAVRRFGRDRMVAAHERLYAALLDERAGLELPPVVAV